MDALLQADVARIEAERRENLPESSEWGLYGGDEIEPLLVIIDVIDAAWLHKLASGEVMPERKGRPASVAGRAARGQALAHDAPQDNDALEAADCGALVRLGHQEPLRPHRGAAAPPQAGPTAHGTLLPARCQLQVSRRAPGGVGHRLGFPVDAAARVHDGLQRDPRRLVSVPARALLAGPGIHQCSVCRHLRDDARVRLADARGRRERGAHRAARLVHF